MNWLVWVMISRNQRQNRKIERAKRLKARKTKTKKRVKEGIDGREMDWDCVFVCAAVCLSIGGF